MEKQNDKVCFINFPVHCILWEGFQSHSPGSESQSMLVLIANYNIYNEGANVATFISTSKN